ncbi:peptide chain release factor 1 [Garciella nitratireducens]|uniref:Peptide chain release factor 1 n=1 Tax=Garciella nitratireducens DSM 15102 TaxID=1121911 RepID=A0A1T4MJL2_9FIRM|nr:peptide chain release factor 1 [Garciella nitratireducens]RBP37795.1 peptide chain release factor 1 [Garciella nitratireducens]SJZ67057.1 peptide chain release factor 1 [Garciella nitratireducens DSM 15102]
MLEKLDFLEGKYSELNKQISDPEIIADQDKWKKLMKEHAYLEPIVEKYREYKKVLDGMQEAKELLEDKLEKDFKEMVEIELEELEEKKEKLEEELKILLIPKDPNDDKNVILEIRAGAGGEEAALFAADLLRMYTRYAERQGWKIETMSSNISDNGGVKEIIVLIQGHGVYSRLKYESGVHRVQRIPATESGGRIHTSTATVAVLPEAEDVDIQINQNDLRIDVFRSSGNGGQSVNTTDSAVRITHLPTGMVVSCQDEKSQLKNKEKAMKILKARLLEIEQQKQNEEIAENRKSQVGTGDRSERIRTYNFPQGRITDHRIGLTVYKLEAFLDGEIDEMIDALITSDQAKKLKEME